MSRLPAPIGSRARRPGFTIAECVISVVVVGVMLVAVLQTGAVLEFSLPGILECNRHLPQSRSQLGEFWGSTVVPWRGQRLVAFDARDPAQQFFDRSRHQPGPPPSQCD